MFLLLLTAGLKVLLTAWTFGMHVRHIQLAPFGDNSLTMDTRKAPRRYISANDCDRRMSWEVAGNFPVRYLEI